MSTQEDRMLELACDRALVGLTPDGQAELEAFLGAKFERGLPQNESDHLAPLVLLRTHGKQEGPVDLCQAERRASTGPRPVLFESAPFNIPQSEMSLTLIHP